jgi:hypothetical protein
MLGIPVRRGLARRCEHLRCRARGYSAVFDDCYGRGYLQHQLLFAILRERGRQWLAGAKNSEFMPGVH